jgi:hypothetical protein
LGTDPFGLRHGRIGPHLIERGLGAVDLRLCRERVQAREHLALADAIAGLDQHLGDASGVAFCANRHVIACTDQARQRHGRRDLAQ